MDNSRHYVKDDSIHEENKLLAFGYSCKLFRDDERAQEINQGVHLIPCMADPSLMIDRFDVRGALTDMKEVEYKNDGILELTEAEQMEQNACEYESYCDYDVYNNGNAEERDFHDEEQKRLQMALASDTYTYNQVDFSYSGETPYAAPIVEEQRTDSPTQLVDGPFAPTQDLNLPKGMDVPRTTKQHKIILKTAKFVASHGAQMEIVLMTKQAGNASFNFMSFDNILNPYYKHIINQIKTGRLKFNKENEGGQEAPENNVQFNLPQVTPDLTPGAHTAFKPSAHCTYSSLITQIREKQKASGVEESEIYSPSTPSSPVTYATPAPVKEKTPVVTQVPSTLPVIGLVDYPSFNQAASDSSDDQDDCTVSSSKNKSPSFDGSKVYDYNQIKWPSPELQMVIDKLACYIVKNGPTFRDIVKNKRDPRFEFLKSGHEYNPYFQCKMQLYNEVYGDTFNHQQKSMKMSESILPKSTSAQRTKYSAKGGRAISFSIKSKDVEATLSNYSTFPVESSTSDEEMEDEEREQRKLLKEQKRQENKLREEKIRKEREAQLLQERSLKEKNIAKGPECASDNDDLYDIFKYAQNLAKDKVINNESVQKTQSKQMERKIKAAAFLGKMNDNGTTNGGPPVYGPHLPVVVKSNMEMITTPAEEFESSNSSLHSCSNNEKAVRHSVSPVPDVSEDSTRNWLMKEASSSPKQLNDTITSHLSPYTGEIPDDSSKFSLLPLSPKEEWSRSRHKKSRKRSPSLSPDYQREKKKKKKSHSSHRRKRRHSRTRSRDRSKSHRSSHKKRKHSSHKDKSKRKKHRKYRSPSLSSLSSESSKSSSNFPSDSDSEVQVISSPNTKGGDVERSSRSSSVISLMETKTSRGDSPSTDANSDKTSSTTLTETLSQPPATVESCDSPSDVQDGKKSAFVPMKSSAMAKITEGLRAKLHALLEKDANA